MKVKKETSGSPHPVPQLQPLSQICVVFPVLFWRCAFVSSCPVKCPAVVMSPVTAFQQFLVFSFSQLTECLEICLYNFDAFVCSDCFTEYRTFRIKNLLPVSRLLFGAVWLRSSSSGSSRTRIRNQMTDFREL